MDQAERLKVVEAVIRACMWGNGAGSLIMDGLDKTLPGEPTWHALYSDNSTRVRRDVIGIITDEKQLNQYLGRGYWLTNFNEDGCALFNPPPMNGIASYVSRELAAKRLPRLPAS